MLKKKYLKRNEVCKVTFYTATELEAEAVQLVGDFNEWNISKHPMSFDKKKGVWSKSISLKPGNQHEFRYCVDGSQWRNDEAADWYVANPYACENGVIEV